MFCCFRRQHGSCTCCSQCLLQRFAHGKAGIQRYIRILKDHLDSAGKRIHPPVPVQFISAIVQCSPVFFQYSGQYPCRSRLAAPAFAYEGKYFAFSYLQGKITDPFTFIEDLCHVFHSENRSFSIYISGPAGCIFYTVMSVSGQTASPGVI